MYEDSSGREKFGKGVGSTDKNVDKDFVDSHGKKHEVPCVKNEKPVKNVTETNKSALDVREKADILYELDSKKKLYNSAFVFKLPDRGARIKKQIDELELALSNLALKSENSDSLLESKPSINGAKDPNHVAVKTDIYAGKGGSTNTNVSSSKDDPKHKAPFKPQLTLNPASDSHARKDCTSGLSSVPKVFSESGEYFCESKNYTLEKKTCFNKEAGDNKGFENDKVYTAYKEMHLTDKSDFSVKAKEHFTNKDSNPDKPVQHHSFGDLKEKSVENDLPSLSFDAQSPSFSKWRNEQEPKSTKLTEAQYLPDFLNASKNKRIDNQIGTTSTYRCMSSSVKSEAVFNIHTSLKTCPLETHEETDPKNLKTELLKHQKRALAWLLWREGQNPPGGIFADDMGLGKTLTMLSLILKQSEKNDHSVMDSKATKIGCTLIVCLASIVHQWNSEVNRHCKLGALKVLIYHGPKRVTDIKKIRNYDIVLTTYNLVLSEGKSSTKGKISPLFEIEWERIILDEAHTIKNHKSQTSQWVFNLKGHRKWAVTGTPIHNDLKDMYSLLKFLQCAPFDDYKVWKKLIDDFSAASVSRRSALMKGIFFRRSKDQIDETGKPIVKLPKKSTEMHELQLSEAEKRIYDKVFDKSKEKMAHYFGKPKLPTADKEENVSFLVLLLRLQQCCNHISLLQADVEDDESIRSSVSDISFDLASLCIDESSHQSASCPPSENEEIRLDHSFDVNDSCFSKSMPSTKIKALFKELHRIDKHADGKEKVVVVSQWVSMLEIVALQLEENKMNYHTIKGSTKPEDRMFVAEDFNTNPNGYKILLLSLKAGGVGLNLIGGNHLFLLDLHWNPSLETQACDRIFRVGQTRDVFIHKFMCKDTIEEKILNLQKQKSYLAKNVLEEGGKRPNISFEDLKLLFEV